jgi:hypothetical protein
MISIITPTYNTNPEVLARTWGWNEKTQEWVILDIPKVDLPQSGLPPTEG